MHLVSAGASDVGQQRAANEDRFALVRPFGPFVVADGMGGHRGGARAAQLAVDAVQAAFGVETFGHTEASLAASVLLANRVVHQVGQREPAHAGMGTTLVALLFSPSLRAVSVAHVGDSRCYRLRDGTFDALTQDHTLRNEYRRMQPGLPESAYAAIRGNILARAIGQHADVRVDVATLPARVGDVYLLCSDGLTGMLDDAAIARVLAGAADPRQAARALVAQANAAGGDDNITALVVRVERGSTA